MMFKEEKETKPKYSESVAGQITEKLEQIIESVKEIKHL